MSNWFVDPMPDEIPYEDILQKAENGEFHKWNFEPFDSQESGYEDVIDELKKYQAADYLAYEREYRACLAEGHDEKANYYKDKMEKMVEDVLKIYRSKNIFPIQYFSDFGAMEEIQKCIAYKAKFDGNTVSCMTGDTEFFNGFCWKRIDQYVKGDKVLQFNPDGTATLVDPLRYIHYQSDDPFYEYASGGLNLCVTGDHKLVFAKEEDGKTKYFFKEMKDCLDYTGAIPANCFYDCTPKKRVNLDWVKLFLELAFNDWYIQPNNKIVLYCDGIRRTQRRKRQRNLERISSLLENLGISNVEVSLNYETIRFACEKIASIFTTGNIPKSWYGLCLEDKISLIRYVKENFNPEEEENYVKSVVEDLPTYAYIQFLAFTTGMGELILDEENDALFVSFSFWTKPRLCYRYYIGQLGQGKNSIKVRTGIKDKYCFTVPTHMFFIRRNNIISVTGNCGAGIGTGLCRWLFPNIFDTPSAHDLNKKDAETQYKKFLNDTYLRRAIRFCYSYKNGCPVPTSVEGGLRLVGSAPSNFRPMNAKAVYERFCPKGGTIYDFCCGFGGRLLGALSSKNNYRYVGTDPCTETMYHLHQLGEYIEQVTGRVGSYELHCCGSEDFRGPANSIDFAFSSPPYFNLEVYSDEPTQCFNKFPELEGWLEGFVRPTIQNICHMLKPGKFYAVNIADFKVGSGQECAYVDEWIRISTEEGMPLFDTVYLGVTARAGSAEQAAGELKKENILIFKKPLW